MKTLAPKSGRPPLPRLEDEDIAFIKAQVAQTNASKVFVAAQFHRELFEEAVAGGYSRFLLPGDVESVKSAFAGAFKSGLARRSSLPELYYRVMESLYGIERTSLPSRHSEGSSRPGAHTQSPRNIPAIGMDSADESSLTPSAPEPQAPPATPRTLAVLPFVDMIPDHENEFLCDGITEDLIIALSRIKALRVPARTSSFAFKNRSEDIRNIARWLGVENVLEGSVRKSGNKLRVTAQLLNVSEGTQLWSQRYDRAMQDGFGIQDDITRAIADELQVHLDGGGKDQPARQPANITAYELYLQGRRHWNTQGPEPRKALCYYDLALLEDPSYSLAYSGMADAYVLLGFYDFVPYRTALSKARSAAEQASSLDVHSAEAHSAMGVVRLFHDWDFRNASTDFETALQANPNHAPTRGWFSLCLAGQGRDQEALEQARLGVKADPFSPFANLHLGLMLLMLGELREGFSVIQHSVQQFPNSPFGYWLLGQANWQAAKRRAALTALKKAVGLSARNPMMLSTFGCALALDGQTVHAREIQQELVRRTSPTPTRPLFLAVLHAALGDKKPASEALELAFKERELWLPHWRAVSSFGLQSFDRQWSGIRRQVETAISAKPRLKPEVLEPD
jgi:TolB-like protein/Tfp pilus assembly protein PilF